LGNYLERTEEGRSRLEDFEGQAAEHPSHFLPRGVNRQGTEFKAWVDYFDSCIGVVDFLKTDDRMKGNRNVAKSVAQYDKCQAYVADFKVQRGRTVEWVIAE
jgi:hypothetical protein